MKKWIVIFCIIFSGNLIVSAQDNLPSKAANSQPDNNFGKLYIKGGLKKLPNLKLNPADTESLAKFGLTYLGNPEFIKLTVPSKEEIEKMPPNTQFPGANRNTLRFHLSAENKLDIRASLKLLNEEKEIIARSETREIKVYKPSDGYITFEFSHETDIPQAAYLSFEIMPPEEPVKYSSSAD